MFAKTLFTVIILVSTTVVWASPDHLMIKKAMLVAPETAVNIDTIYKSNFADDVIECKVAVGHCDVLPTGDFVNLNFTGQDMSGKRICITNHILFYVSNLQGEEGNPAVISNCDGIGQITDTNKALWILNSQYVRVTGTGHSGYPLGLKLSGAHNTIDVSNGSSNIEIDHVDVRTSSDGNTGTGISIRSYPACEEGELKYTRPNFTQHDSIVRDSYIHDTINEGLYIGTSHHQQSEGAYTLDCDGDGNFEPTPQADLKGVVVENNILFNIGGDGIQVGAAVENAKIENNLVLGFGEVAGWPHIQGIEVNPGSKVDITYNWIETTTPESSGVGLSIQGAGVSRYINNVFIGMNKAIHGLRSTGPTDDPHFVWYNTFILSGESNAASIWCSDEVAVNQMDFANNIFINSTTPWADSQYGGTGCWQEAGQWLTDDINELGFENPFEQRIWPIKGSVLTGQGAITSPAITYDFFGDMRITNEPGAFAVK